MCGQWIISTLWTECGQWGEVVGGVMWIRWSESDPVHEINSTRFTQNESDQVHEIKQYKIHIKWKWFITWNRQCDIHTIENESNPVHVINRAIFIQNVNVYVYQCLFQTVLRFFNEANVHFYMNSSAFTFLFVSPNTLHCLPKILDLSFSHTIVIPRN
jgi:hypothetical protein